MTNIQLTPIDVTGLSISSNTCNLRRDLVRYVDYVSNRSVKRNHRTNDLSKTDLKRLAKLMSDPLAVADVAESGCSSWISFVDEMALYLGFVQYNVEGLYFSYSSEMPSYPDNYITFNDQRYWDFLAKPPLDQEKEILNSMVNAEQSEFFSTTAFSILDSFNTWGSGIGILPTLNFPDIRRFLFTVLKDVQSDTWFSTASLIDYLKTDHPFFLIPEHPEVVKRRSSDYKRYDNFMEYQGQLYFSDSIKILETDSDCFERVEGRYVERFLERIPLSLGYIDVAYGSNIESDIHPSINQLKAFRLKPSFLRLLNEQVSPPVVTVQPNFEIHVDSELYPFKIMAELNPLTDLVSDDTTIILKLHKKKVTQYLAANENVDIVGLLKSMSIKEIPQNVAMELEEWEGHSESFILYKGFSLLEGSETAHAKKYSVESVSPDLQLVQSPQELFLDLEKAELVPMRVKHGKNQIKYLPKTARTLFTQKTTRPKAKSKRKKSVLKREIHVTLHFPSNELLEIFRKDLLLAHCPVEVHQTKNAITFEKKFESQIKETITRIKKDHHIKLQDIK